jgi:(p)ppGpp synthase/HD superfamily hydrolase
LIIIFCIDYLFVRIFPQVPISYVLNNGDVVSILTGEGRPTTEWMRFAKSRSTRSKLRAYFRTKQHDTVTRSGESMFFDYLALHRAEMRDSSYLGYEFEIPTDKSELSRFLPGRSHYTDVEELLFAIGESGRLRRCGSVGAAPSMLQLR